MKRAAGSESTVMLRTPTGLRLEENEVHVWRATLDERPDDVVAALRALLSTDELERARKFYFERDRRRFVVCRGILRTLLGSYLDQSPEKIAFGYGPNDKPAVATGATRPLYFNLAHSDDLALYAFTRAGEIGIDVERIRDMPDWQSIAEVSFSPAELARLRRCAETRRREEFFRSWTRQEAILKAAGTGLGAATTRGRDFHVRPLDAGPGFAAAYAVARNAGRTSCRPFVVEVDTLLNPVRLESP